MTFPFPKNVRGLDWTQPPMPSPPAEPTRIGWRRYHTESSGSVSIDYFVLPDGSAEERDGKDGAVRERFGPGDWTAGRPISKFGSWGGHWLYPNHDQVVEQLNGLRAYIGGPYAGWAQDVLRPALEHVLVLRKQLTALGWDPVYELRSNIQPLPGASLDLRFFRGCGQTNHPQTAWMGGMGEVAHNGQLVDHHDRPKKCACVTAWIEGATLAYLRRYPTIYVAPGITAQEVDAVLRATA